MVFTAPVVCSVPNTRCPVSAAVIANRFRIAQLADQNHVGIFAHGGAHALGESGNVRVELALNDLALFAAVNKLDWILKTYDVEAPRGVEVVDHRRKRRRLAGARRAGNEHHALMIVAELGDDRRQRQFLERGHFGWNCAEGGADARLLAEHVDAKTPALTRHVREVQIAPLGEIIRLGFRQNLGDVALKLHGTQIAELDRHQIAVHAQHRRHAHREVNVGAALLRAQL
jgi:hypothetical protein